MNFTDQMETTAPVRRPFCFIIVMILLSTKFNTPVKISGIMRANFDRTQKEPYRVPLLDTIPNVEEDFWVATQCYQHMYLNNTLSTILGNEQYCDALVFYITNVNNISHLHETTRTMVNNNIYSSSSKTKQNEGNPYRSWYVQYFPKLNYNAYSNQKLITSRFVEYISFCFLIILVYVNRSIISKSNFCKYGNVKYLSDINSKLYFKGITANDTPESIFDTLFSFRFESVPKVNIVAYPSSMESYLQDIKNKTPTHELMKHEWARYNSFRNFPKSSRMTPIRLSQAGFYYSGVAESVTCFSCGQKYDTWNEDETALEVHQRISPSCAFMCGNDTSNISIHETSDQLSFRPSNANSHGTYSHINEHQEVNGANGGPEDINTITTSLTETVISSSNESHQPQTPQSGQINVDKTPVCEESSIVANINTTVTAPVNQSSRLFGTTAISYNNAKHQEYAVTSVRESSYAGWREQITPAELSEAGFYYAGFQDCVRCFYCGGGLKNWDYGDSPWVEHARWYPNCDYLRQAKGEEFVQMYREDGGTEEHQETTSHDPSSPPNAATGSVNEGNINMHYTLDVDMSSAAVSSVLEMGYSRERVENIVRRYRQMHGNRTITAESLMSIIFESQPILTESNQTTLSPNESSISALNITTREHSALQDRNQTGVSTSASADARNEGRKDSDKSKKRSTKTTHGSKKAEYTSLVEENRSLREQMMCKICMDKDANIVFLPCGHLVACTECAPAIRKCAVCRKLIKGTVRAFPS